MKNSFRRSVTGGSLAAAVAAAISLAVALPAQATTDTLDQSQTLTFSLQRQISFLAQTFTAGMSGQLDRVSLASDTTTGFANIRVSIQTVTSSGAPSGTTLGSSTAFTGGFVCCRQFHDFVLNPTVSITSGTKYAIVVQTLGGVFTWYNSSTLDAYTGGQLYVGSTWLTGSQWGEDFAFKTWVVTTSNAAPSVAADSAAVSVNEGTAPRNTGTFSDPDGDTVALSASTGAVTKTGTSSGNWAWTDAAAQAGPAQTVTITANDGQGNATSASFTLTVIPNKAPSVGVDTAGVSADEGTAPSNTGTYLDPDGDTVSLSASQGSVTKTGTSSGAWTWTQPASDEAAAQTVTVTANDGHGHTPSATFTVTVNPVKPIARIVTDPPEVFEGSTEPFTGAATTAFSGDGADLIYSWSVTKNGARYASGTGPSFGLTPDDEGTYVVTFMAKDKDSGLWDSESTTVTGLNVKPTARITGVTAPSLLVAQESVGFMGNFSDPGSGDSHSVIWSFGDGVTSSSNFGPGGSANLSASHIYTAAGTYTVTLTVRDDDGGQGQASTTVTVKTVPQALSVIVGLVNGLPSLNAGQKNSLIAKLNAASASAARGDNKACNNQLNAVLNELSADVNTGKLSAQDAAKISGPVYIVKGALGSYNRFLEWWPLAE